MTPEQAREKMTQQLVLRNASNAKTQLPTPPQTRVSQAVSTPPQASRVSQTVATPQPLSRSPLTLLPNATNQQVQLHFVPSNNSAFGSPWDQFSVAFLIKAIHFYDPEQHGDDSKRTKAWTAVANEVRTALQTHGLPRRNAKEMMALWRELSWHRENIEMYKDDLWEPHFDKYDHEVVRMMDEVIQSHRDRKYGRYSQPFSVVRQKALAAREENLASRRQQQALRDSISKWCPPQLTPTKQDQTTTTPSRSARPETSNDSPSDVVVYRKRPREAADEGKETSSDDPPAEAQQQSDAMLRTKEAEVRAIEDANVQRGEMLKIKEKQKDVQKEQLDAQQAQLDMTKQLIKMVEELKKEMRDLRNDVDHAQGQMAEGFKEKLRDLRHEVSHTQGQMAFMASMVPAMISGGGMAGRVPQPLARATPWRGKSPDPEEYCAPTAESSTEAAESPSSSKTPGSPPARRATRASTAAK
ncbi:uncharacterized protein PAN0_003c1790 [Moesziomyces antarcticus]|uniref:Uncharacterized protein n=1 Tax=Pseudozyma antarctica TaxID=84753 RepID=A0A5C3FJ49_PSEA2|nr:uncharacterized protein PAN0_003c1790 [Moesziomyces antarcticus]GAK63585.1 hypothetical protein PAN0_003c1790 [Moesziomyces antarcticus]SPO44176.1 uncharacterized protein PSANT_01861 [Moesziomyces antarcticus]